MHLARARTPAYRLISQRTYSSLAQTTELTLHDFHSHYFSKSPVVIRGYFTKLPAISLWGANNFHHLRKCDDVHVPVELTRGSATYASSEKGDQSSFEQAEMPLSYFLSFLEQAEKSLTQGIPLSDVKVYLAQHALFDSLPQLYKDVCQEGYTTCRSGKLVPPYCNVDKGDTYNINAWIGLSTLTPLHRDPYHNIYAQLYRKKDVILFPPAVEHELSMQRDPLKKNSSSLTNIFRDSGLLSESTREAGLKATLAPGDALYIPQGWTHTFQGESGISASVNWWFR